MSARDHEDALTLWRAICAEVGVEAPFAVVCLCALEALLHDVRAAKAEQEPGQLHPAQRHRPHIPAGMRN